MSFCLQIRDGRQSDDGGSSQRSKERKVLRAGIEVKIEIFHSFFGKPAHDKAWLETWQNLDAPTFSNRFCRPSLVRFLQVSRSHFLDSRITEKGGEDLVFVRMFAGSVINFPSKYAPSAQWEMKVSRMPCQIPYPTDQSSRAAFNS